jgi:epidermal growth factor receptor substrate 15
MHLLASYKTRTLTALPQTLPAGLIEAASRRPAAQQAPPPINSAIPRQFSGAGAGRTASPLARQAFGAPPPNDWLITPSEKEGFDQLFDRLTKEAGGLDYISGDQAGEFFSQSNLPVDDLAQIWDLSNIRGRDQLNRDEFAVAMYLIKEQRTKPAGDLPKQLPPTLVPPSLRRPNFGSQAPQTQPPTRQVHAPMPPRPSATDDLFGLDALSGSSPPAPVQQQQGTGGSPSFARGIDSDPFGNKASSPTSQSFSQGSRDNSSPFNKRFVPTSSFGQGLTSQTTGGSGTSSTVQSRGPAMDDLLGDNDPEISKKLTPDHAELANIANQMGSLTNQMRDVQSKKAVTESDLNSISSQKRDMELRLAQFRTQYEQEFKAVKALESQLATSRKETAKIQQELTLLEADYNGIQGQHREMAGALENERRENASLKDRMRQINAEIAQLRPQLDKMKSDARHEKGMVSINKKQLEKSETERDGMKTEMGDLSRQAQEASRGVPAEGSAVASPAAGGQSTNPFFRKSPQQSFDNTMSPGGFARSTSKESNKFPDNIFGPSFGSSPSTGSPAPAAATSFRDNSFPPPSEPSVTSSDRGVPTPSASPRPEAPAPPASRQITSSDLPLHGSRGGDSVATSVRVETPTSRHTGADTPTNAGGSSPIPLSFERPEHTRSDTTTSTGAAMFDRNASPVGSSMTDTSNRGKQAEPDFFRSFGNSIPGSFPAATPLQSDLTGDSGFSERSKQSAPKTDPFTFPSQPTRTATNKSDFDQAFARSKPAQGSSTNGSVDDPATTKFKSEFPPIELNEGDESDSEHGFDDDFTQQSPAHQRKASQPQFKESRPSKDTPSNSFFMNQPPASELPTPGAQKSPPTYDQSAAASSGGPRGSTDFPQEFGGLLPSRENPMSPQSQASQSPERSFASPASGGHGQALFGGPSTSKSASTAPTTAFSGSPPPTTSTPVSTVPSDAYHSAPSHPSGSTEKSINSNQHSAAHRSPPLGDDFESGFDDLNDAKEDDVSHDDDLLFGSQHHEFDEFDPNFDSPMMSKAGTMASERTPTAGGQSSGFDSSFGDFGDSFKPLSVSGVSKSGHDDWDTMMQSISGEHGGATAAGESSKGGPFGEKSAFGDHHDAFAAPPEAPEPPKLSRTVTQGTEHDYDDLKKLMQLGYPRTKALEALETYDYDFDKVCSPSWINAIGDDLLTAIASGSRACLQGEIIHPFNLSQSAFDNDCSFFSLSLLLRTRSLIHYPVPAISIES